MPYRVRGPTLWQLLVQYQSATPLHHVERRADHVRVLAQRVRPRREREVGMQSAQNLVLARHVMRAWGHRTERRPPQNRLPLACTQQVGQVGMARRELRYLQLTNIESGRA